MRFPGWLARFKAWIAPALTGPAALAFLPALSLGAFWLAGEVALMLVALGLPLAFAALLSAGDAARHNSTLRTAAKGATTHKDIKATLDNILADCDQKGLRSACFVLAFDDFPNLADRDGPDSGDMAMQGCGQRLLTTLREDDTLIPMGDGRFGLFLKPRPRIDLEFCITLAGRLLAVMEDPVSVQGTPVYLSCSIGFCLRADAPGNTVQDWIAAACAALAVAQTTGSGTIRAYTPDLHKRGLTGADLANEASGALENGQIQPLFQPQICTDTGQVTGFELLPHWSHPEHARMTPEQLTLLMQEAGLSEPLDHLMLQEGLSGLKSWDTAGLEVPEICVSFATDTVRNPDMPDWIKWELDRFELDPTRLRVAIRGSDLADCSDSSVARNILSLRAIECRIDLDGSGAGHAAIADTRRLAINRIRIDRSLVVKSDIDPEQQRIIGAILTMAERLDVQVLAQGVDTAGEHAILAQLGCNHVQGLCIAPPMPVEQTLEWLAGNQAKLESAQIARRDVGLATPSLRRPASKSG